MLGMMRWRSVAKMLLVMALVGVLGLSGWVDRGGNGRAIAAPRPVVKVSNKVFETAPPQLIEDLQAEFEDNQPQVKVLEPKPNEVLQDNTVAVRFQVTDLPIFKNERLGLGPHLHVLLDNQTYQPVYDLSRPLTLDNLSPGTHTLRVFASRPWHESFKNEGAYAQVTFHVYTKTDENQPNPDQPLLTYSRPQGSYGAEPVMLDFYLTNAPLHLAAQEDTQDDIADWRIRITVNGTEFVLDQWEPLYLKGFKPGKNWVKLEYIDEQGNPVNNLYSNTARLVTLEPGGQDGLARIVRGEVSLEEARTITNPTYTYTPPAPPEPVSPEPVVVPEPEPVKPEPVKPEPVKLEPVKPEPIALPSPVPTEPSVSTPTVVIPREVPPLRDKPEPQKALKTLPKPAIAEPPITATPVPSPAAIAPKPSKSKSPSLLRPRPASTPAPIEESRQAAPTETSTPLIPSPDSKASVPAKPSDVEPQPLPPAEPRSNLKFKKPDFLNRFQKATPSKSVPPSVPATRDQDVTAPAVPILKTEPAIAPASEATPSRFSNRFLAPKRPSPELSAPMMPPTSPPAEQTKPELDQPESNQPELDLPKLDQVKVRKPSWVKSQEDRPEPDPLKPEDQLQADPSQDDKPEPKKFEFGTFKRTLPKAEPQAELKAGQSDPSENTSGKPEKLGRSSSPSPSESAASASDTSENGALSAPAAVKPLEPGEPQPSAPKLNSLLNRFRQKAMDLQQTALDLKDKASAEVKKEVSGLKVPTLQDLQQRNRRPDLPPPALNGGNPSEESKIPLSL